MDWIVLASVWLFYFIRNGFLAHTGVFNEDNRLFGPWNPDLKAIFIHTDSSLIK